MPKKVIHVIPRSEVCYAWARPPRPQIANMVGNWPRTGLFTRFRGKMTAPLKSIEGSADIARAMGEIGRRARAASHVLALAPAEQKNRALEGMAAAVRAQTAAILAANAEDVAEARAAGVTGA